MNQDTKKEIKAILHKCVHGAIQRTSNRTAEQKPFHEAFLSPKIMAISAFERSFSTSLGQGPMEEISYLLALASGAEAERQKKTAANVLQGAIDEIERIMSALNSSDAKPDWPREVNRVTAHQKGSYVVREVITDLWVKRNGTEIFISIKTVKPNKDQTNIAKNNMLLLKAHDPGCMPYFGLYYNPTGHTKAEYKWAIPNKFFNMQTDSCVLIGQEYWDFIGGPGTYNTLLAIFQEVGQETTDQLNQL